MKDCTCRAWTFDGEYIGTFGQEERWDLLDDSTWKHPFTPDDVLGKIERNIKKSLWLLI